jgi:hypothetical protein
MRGATTDSFRQLDARRQHAIELKHLGRTHLDIARILSVKFDKPCSKSWVDKAFKRGGSLQSALQAYREALADAALQEARALIPTYAARAAAVLDELSQPGHEAKIRVAAARTLASSLIGAINRDLADMPKSSPTQEAINAEIEQIARSYTLRD